MTKIYTKTGDCGETALRNGKKVPKNHSRIEAYGTVDEINDLLGMAVTLLDSKKYVDQLQLIQKMLFEVGATLANPKVTNRRPDDADVMLIEKQIDEMENKLPELHTFILPGGSKPSAVLQLARSTTRRAERRVVTLNQHQDVPDAVLKYLNRLSDYLFTLARLVNFEKGIDETPWRQDRI